ncbi:MAG: dethiobiotin synthase [Flavobacteriales bacterium]|nr:dethiobiotin synthase [Flavobacteriales bacterium]
MSKKTYFITGIDTDAGKTWVTGAFAKYLHSIGKKVITQKIAQTGCVNSSEDIERHRMMMGVNSFPEDEQGLTCPYIFSVPCSPHLAAEIDGGHIEVKKIEDARKELERRYDYVLSEGVGGLCVPMDRQTLLIDWLATQDMDTILVTTAKLGSINHTLMSLELLRTRGINVTALVYNFYPITREEIEKDNIRVFKDYLAKYYPKCLFITLGDMKKADTDITVFAPLV